MNRMNGIRFTRNTQNTRPFGKFLAGNPTRPPAPVAWLPVGRRSSSQVTSAISIPFSERMRVHLEIEIPSILLFRNRNSNSQNTPRRMQPERKQRQFCSQCQYSVRNPTRQITPFTCDSLKMCFLRSITFNVPFCNRNNKHK